jgi:hypothetical protein
VTICNRRNLEYEVAWLGKKFGFRLSGALFYIPVIPSPCCFLPSNSDQIAKCLSLPCKSFYIYYMIALMFELEFTGDRGITREVEEMVS